MLRPFAITTSLVAAVLASACGGGDKAPERTAAPAVEVRVAPVEQRQIHDVFEAGGTVAARTTATVASRLMAPVREVRVQPGDRVRAGQVLVVLDDRDLSAGARQASTAREAADEGANAAAAGLEGARAQLTLARASHERIAGLRERNSATAQELDQAVAALRGAGARLAAAEAQVRQARAAQASAGAASEAAGVTASFAMLTAPFDGLVTEKFVEPGNLATPGQPLVRLEDARGYRLDVRVDESRAGHVKVGDTMRVMLDRASGPPVETAATVNEVSRAVDADARAFLVKLTLPEQDVRSGMFGRALLPGPPRPAVLVPLDAVVRTGQVTSVFVAEGTSARLRLVHLGQPVGTWVEVLAGLSAGERVVIDPPPGLSDGRSLKIGDVPAAGGAR